MFKMGSELFLAAAAAVLLGVSPLCDAYPSYQQEIPNGERVPHPCKPNYMWRGVGHTSPLGGGDRNDFGKAFKAHGKQWTEALCREDSDGDGKSNGEELGDPHCTWSKGDAANITAAITHPGVCEPYDAVKCEGKNIWLTCDVETFHCDALQNDPDVRNVTLRFKPTVVPSTETNYYCMTFDLPGDDTYHLVATEPYIDNAEVMHHILVYGCGDADNLPSIPEPTACGMEATECRELIGLWQVGFPGHCMDPMTGFKFGRGEFTRIKMEFHWNNPRFTSGLVDSSGMRFFYTPNLRPTSAGTMMIGQMYLEIPPLQDVVQVTGSCSSECTQAMINERIHVVQALNHMHYMGRSQSVQVFRNNRLVETLTYDEVYNYDAPVSHIHSPAIQLLPGDEIRTTCNYTSRDKATVTYYGEATSDEMCFAFLIFYPREALKVSRNCLSYEDRSFCRRGDDDDDDLGDCDFSTFLNESIPEQRQLIYNIASQCQTFSPCTEECQRLLMPVWKNPCMRGQAFDGFKDFMVEHSLETMQFLSQIMSCQPRPPCPQCPQCPDSSTVTVQPTREQTHMEREAAAEETTDEAECDFSVFLNESIPAQRQLIITIASKCHPFTPCSPDCSEVVTPLWEHPCMKGPKFQSMKEHMLQSKETMRFVSQLMSCKPQPPCPRCRQFPNVDDDDDDDDTSDAKVLAPSLISMSVFLVVSLFVF